MAARSEGQRPRRGVYNGWLSKVKSDDAKAKWLTATGKRYFTIDFDNQALYYSHDKNRARASELVCFKDILGASVAVPENPPLKPPSRLRRSFSGSSLGRALAGADTRLDCMFTLHLRHRTLRLIAKSSVVAVWWVDMLNAACMMGLNLQGLEGTSRGNLSPGFTCFATVDRPSGSEPPSDLLSQASHTTADYSVQSACVQSVTDCSDPDHANPFDYAITEDSGNPFSDAISERNPFETDADCEHSVGARKEDIDEAASNPFEKKDIDGAASNPFEVDAAPEAASNPIEVDAAPEVVGSTPRDEAKSAITLTDDDAGNPFEGDIDKPTKEEEASFTESIDQTRSAPSATEVTVWRYSQSGVLTSSEPKSQSRRRARSHAGEGAVGAGQMSAEERIAADMALLRKPALNKSSALASGEHRSAAGMALLRK